MAFPQGRALVIGVGAYEWAPELDVPVAVEDARAVAEVIEDNRACGYLPERIQWLSDEGATKAGILGALERMAKEARPEDTIFLYYCGHGALGTDGNYTLVSHDARRKKSSVLTGTGVSEGELLDRIKAVEAQRMLLIFNACYAGNISPTLAIEDEDENLVTSSLPEDTSSALLATGSGRIILTACREGQKSYIGSGKLSIFTQALVDGLRGKGVRNSGGFISAYGLYEALFERVHETVSEQLHQEQEPELTVLKGVGPFAVSLFRGASSLGDFDAGQPAPELSGVRQVKPEKAQKLFQQRVIQTGGVNFGQANQVQVGDDVVGRDQYTGPVTQVNVQLLGQEGLETIIQALAVRLGVNKQELQNPARPTPTAEEQQQIQQVQAVEQQAAARGMSLTPQAAFQLGMLAAYRRDPQAALGYFRQATQAAPHYSDAFEGVVWILNSQAMNDFSRRDLSAAAVKLVEARQAAEKTDPTDPNALTLRGYLAKLEAQLAEAQGNIGLRNQLLQEAGRYFQGALRYDPNFVFALNGQGNVLYFLGYLDGAIESIRRAIELNPVYPAAHNDLAIAYEAKMKADPLHARDWCRKALEEWKAIYNLAPRDPMISAEYLMSIGQRIQWLEQQCT